jgi:hypothetical protein
MVHPRLDGCEMRDDAYLEISGMAGRYLRAGKDPPGNLREAARAGPGN